MIITNDHVVVLVPRTGSTSTVERYRKVDPSAVILEQPHKHTTYKAAKQYNKPVKACLRNPTDWLISFYNAHQGLGNRMNPSMPYINAVGTIEKIHLLELYPFLSKWYFNIGVHKQMDWIGDSEIILFDEWHKDQPIHINQSKPRVTSLSPQALELAHIIWEEDYLKYNELINA